MSKTVSEIIDTLNDEQRQILYHLVGHAVETGRNYLAGNGDFDNSLQRKLRKIYDEFNEEQKTMATYLIKEAIKSHRKGER